ncbi:MAG: hypothetical protein ACXADY_02775 [Candidatus Hodarchaeales archaeon]
MRKIGSHPCNKNEDCPEDLISRFDQKLPSADIFIPLAQDYQFHVYTPIYKGKKGLELAKIRLQTLKVKYDRLPKTNDRGVGGIESAVGRGEWRDYIVLEWNDLIIATFGRENE